jgi:hypothetical protein
MATKKTAGKEKPSRRFIHGHTVSMSTKEWEAFDRIHEIQHFVRDASLSFFVHSDPPMSASETVNNVELLVAELDKRGYFASLSVVLDVVSGMRGAVANPRPKKRS